MGLILLFTALLSPVFADQAAVVPKLKIEFWNDYNIVYQNNCYNYSTNRSSLDFAQPGSASGSIYKSLTCTSVYEAASKDLGMVPSPFFKFTDKKDATLIALVVWPGGDFHWYRRDDNGKWSHKMGSTPATDKDDSGKEILDPEKADRGRYKDFCGYFKIESFPKDADEQNAGYVRIGRMKDLPEKLEPPKQPEPPQQSVVEVNMYSGRPNPKIPLRELLGQSHSAALFQGFATETMSPRLYGMMEIEAIATELRDSEAKLGYRGLILHDVEGLLYPAGTVVKMSGNKAVVLSDSGAQPVYFKSDLVRKIEKLIAPQ